jgi:hypothetical protein
MLRGGPGYHSGGNIKGKRENSQKGKEKKGKRRDLLVL